MPSSDDRDIAMFRTVCHQPGSRSGWSIIVRLAKAFGTAAPAAVALLVLPAPAIASDCDAASGEVAKAICGDGKLRTLDERIARRYAALLDEMDEEAAGALREDQEWYVAARGEALALIEAERDKAEGEQTPISAYGTDSTDWEETWGEVLLAWLETRAVLLESMVGRPGPGLEGLWTNAGGGEVLVAPNEDGSLSLLAHIDETLIERWTCRASGRAKSTGSKARFVDPEVPDWNILVQRKGGSLQVEEQREDGQIASSPFCGLNGGIKGRYFQLSLPLFKRSSAP